MVTPVPSAPSAFKLAGVASDPEAVLLALAGKPTIEVIKGIAQRRRRITGAGFYGNDQYRFQLAPLQRVIGRSQDLFAKTIVLVSNADSADAHGGEVADQAVDLIGVTGAQVEHAFGTGGPDGRRAGVGRQDRQAGFLSHGDQGLVIGGAKGAEQGEGRVPFDEGGHVLQRFLGVIPVVFADQLDEAAVDTALCIDGVKVDLGTFQHFLPQVAQGAGQRGTLPQGDGVAGDAGFCQRS